MRINVYSQEITDETVVTQKVSNTGLVYTSVGMILHSSKKLHHPPMDDDRSCVMFWLPKSTKNREMLSRAFRAMADAVDNATPETGLD